MEFIKKPMAIETRSMELIAPYLEGMNLSPEETKVYSRIIHASGDPGYAPLVRIHPQAIEAGIGALREGCNIYTDVEMVRTGINKRRLTSLGGEVFCRIANPDIAREAKAAGLTRSLMAMRSFGHDLDGSIVAIGNAPTALFEVLRLVQEENARPVGAADSKHALAKQTLIPYITVEGTKGGSPIAAAVVNAMLYLIDNNRD